MVEDEEIDQLHIVGEYESNFVNMEQQEVVE